MCGILGVHGPSAKSAVLNDAIACLKHRGPDAQAQIQIGSLSAGHVRLKIIDVSDSANQPMKDPTGRYVLIYNGEIYNYRTIAAELTDSGVQLLTKSDTEVLLHLLIKEGIDGIEKVNGFFAFAFYDSYEDELILARDRVGIKPLYYSIDSEDLIFSSELNPILLLKGKSEIEPTALHYYLRLNYVPDPLSLVKGVQRLLPGEYLKKKGDEISFNRYFDIFSRPKISGENTLRELLEESVRDRMISDVPLGCFLSGGIDSSIIAALACAEKKGMKTFSIGFKDNTYFDETQHAESVAEHIGSDHQTIILHPDDMLHHVAQVLESIDEPFADSSAIAVHALCEHTRKHVKVALSGDGADELFGGYNKHQAHLRAINPDWKARLAPILSPLFSDSRGTHKSKSRNLARQLKRFEKGRSLSYIERYWTWASWTEESMVSELLEIQRDESLYQRIKNIYGPQSDSMEAILIADTRLVLPNDMLVKVDRMSMANSLEVRVPFLDHRIVSFAHGLMASERMSLNRGKLILKKEFNDLLPSNIFERKKKGFEVPLEDWFHGPLNKRLQGIFDDDVLRSTGWFDNKVFGELGSSVRKRDSGPSVHLLWALLVLHSFLSRHPMA